MKCKKLVRAIIAFAVAGSMSMTVNATSISDLKDQKDQKESKKEEAEDVKAQVSANADKPFLPSWRKNRIQFWMRLQNWMRR